MLFIFVGILAAAQVVLPRKWAFLPLIIAAAHIGNGEILPQLTPSRTIIVCGLLRAVFGGYFSGMEKTKLDYAVGAFAAIAVLSSMGHDPDPYIPSPFNARVGLVLNIGGAYLYGRIYLSGLNEVIRYATFLPIVLMPLALGMSSEQATRINPYYFLGSRSETAMERDGKFRAQGPFTHPILAGTCGATALPFAFLLWKRKRKGLAITAAVTCMAIVLACASSGPLASVVMSVVVVAMWKWREKLKLLLYGALTLATLYTVTRGRGPWFLMASLDLVGGSTGWHRASLIDQAYKNLDEWWLFGTDYTRHWMASGTRSNPNMVDLTNYYIHLGVIGGLGLTVGLIAILWISFGMLRKRMNEMRENSDPDEIVIWCVGGALATHAAGFIAISYFDQMFVFFYILVGAIPGLLNSPTAQEEAEEIEEGYELKHA